MITDFLALFGKPDTVHSFTSRTLHNAELTRIFHGAAGRLMTRLAIQNRDFKGDIWFTVNRTNGTGRTAEDITHLRAFFVDCDDGSPDSWPLPPSAIVESSPGKTQAYWILRDELPVTPELAAHWAEVEHALVVRCGGDLAAKDLSRVLRFPGFMNWKYPEHPTVTVTDVSEARYTIEEIEAAVGRLAVPTLQAVRNDAPEALEPLEVRVSRYRRWLDAITDPPEVAKGSRNQFFFKKAAYGVRELGLPVGDAAGVLEEYACKWYPGDDKYDLDKLIGLCNNAVRHGQRATGSGAGAANFTVTMDDEILNPVTTGNVVAITKPVTKAAAAGKVDDQAKKVRDLAIRAKAELMGDYAVIADKKGKRSWAAVAGPNELSAVEPEVIIGEMVRRYGAEVTPSVVKRELFPSWSFLMTPINTADIRPFVFKSDLSPGWSWQRLPFDPATVACPETFTALLRRTSADEARSLILWIGSVFDYSSPREQYLYLHGDGNDGKSTLLKALMRAFARQGTATMNASELHGHGTTRLEGARLVCFMDENNNQFMSSGTFKHITGDDSMTINPKGTALRDIAIIAKVAIASNHAPVISGDAADRRRIVAVKFKSYENIAGDQNFKEQMLRESDQIMQYCIAAYQDWAAKNPKQLIPVGQEVMAEIMENSLAEEIADLAQGHFEFAAGAKISASGLKSVLHRVDTATYRKVTTYLKARGCKRVLEWTDGQPSRVWTGVRARGVTVSLG